jgi:Mycothiol maleylpyruvate isomerase N-terminal domain
MTRAAAFLDAARRARALLGDPAVAAAWAETSALPGFTVGGLAAHLASQIFSARDALGLPSSTQEHVALLDHYARAAWVGADRDAEVNVTIRNKGEQIATEGPDGLLVRVEQALADLERALPGQPDEFRIEPPAGPWSLSLDDFLITRMMEMVVHSDDLAHSLNLPTPSFPPEVEEPVLSLLTQLAVRRHGSTAVIRALTRVERAPASIAAF